MEQNWRIRNEYEVNRMTDEGLGREPSNLFCGHLRGKMTLEFDWQEV